MPVIRAVGISRYCVSPLMSLSTALPASSSMRQVDAGARGRTAVRPLVRHAAPVHDRPQRVRIVRPGESGGSEPEPAQQAGEQQAHDQQAAPHAVAISGGSPIACASRSSRRLTLSPLIRPRSPARRSISRPFSNARLVPASRSGTPAHSA